MGHKFFTAWIERTSCSNFATPMGCTTGVRFDHTVILIATMTLREPRTLRPGPTENPSGLMSAGLIGPVQVKIME